LLVFLRHCRNRDFLPRFDGNQAAFGGIVAYNSGLAGFLAGITG
jgi:hypothetical protein